DPERAALLGGIRGGGLRGRLLGLGLADAPDPGQPRRHEPAGSGRTEAQEPATGHRLTIHRVLLVTSAWSRASVTRGQAATRGDGPILFSEAVGVSMGPGLLE